MKKKNVLKPFRIFSIIFIIVFINDNLLFAQSSIDNFDYIAISKPINVLSTYLDKRLNTYSLNSGLTVNYDLEDLNFRLFENFNSKFVKSGSKNRRDEQNLLLLGSYKISSQVTSGISADNKILSDDRKIEINQASISNVSLFTLYSPQPGMEFSPFIGYSNNRQIGENDYGLIYGIEGVAEESDISDFNLTSQLKFRNEDISTTILLTMFLTRSVQDLHRTGKIFTILQISRYRVNSILPITFRVELKRDILLMTVYVSENSLIFLLLIREVM